MQPEGVSTDLARAISESLEVDRPQGHALVLFSDGIQNAGGRCRATCSAQPSVAKAMNVPIWTKTFGGKTELADLEITVPRPQELVFVGQTGSAGRFGAATRRARRSSPRGRQHRGEGSRPPGGQVRHRRNGEDLVRSAAARRRDCLPTR